ncbi:MAG: dTDP-4-dehydrorhamnose 3,5-epimerase [Candidatus Marinimicrobia bacterium]|jgi:dTDP-4-dehydrorhamnose 3,5-epimerase|nr:dTDP-4-dehydrorhamnose 3,5-epimerase [Candidatus Neomarinimicrobiota bacterium]
MDGVTLTPLKQITHPKGDIFHAMKASDDGFSGFGEAYFSTVNQGEVKGWKKHTEMTLNLVVVIGEIEFVVYDDNSFYSVKLSKNNYQRLTVESGLWLAFRGISVENMLLNLASIEHNTNESKNVDMCGFNYDWNET